jgi:hypothetical protein
MQKPPDLPEAFGVSSLTLAPHSLKEPPPAPDPSHRSFASLDTFDTSLGHIDTTPSGVEIWSGENLTVFKDGIKRAELCPRASWKREVIRMNNCRLLQPKHLRGEEQLGTLDFSGNKPAVPPLTTEPVASVIYLVEEDEPRSS